MQTIGIRESIQDVGVACQAAEKAIEILEGHHAVAGILFLCEAINQLGDQLGGKEHLLSVLVDTLVEIFDFDFTYPPKGEGE